MRTQGVQNQPHLWLFPMQTYAQIKLEREQEL